MFWFLTVNYKRGCHRKGCEFVLALVPISCISRLGWMLGTDRRPLGKNKQREKYYYEKWNINFPLSSLTGKSTWQGKKDFGKTLALGPLPRRPAKRTQSFERSSPDRSRPRASKCFFTPQVDVCRRQMIKSGAFTGVGHAFEFRPLINYKLHSMR